MPGFLSTHTLIADDPGKLGQTCPQFADSGTLFTPNSTSAPGGVLVGSNIVPRGYYHSLKTLSLSAWNQSSSSSQSNAAPVALGVVSILINGAVVFEFRSMDGMAYCIAGGDEMVSEYLNQSQQFNFGDGFTVPAGQAVLVRVTPELKDPIRWCIDLYGSETQHATTVTYTTGANQNILNYTPTSDWTIKGLAFSSDTSAQVLGQMRLEYNSLPVFNLGDIGMDETIPTPMTNGWSNVSGYGHGGCFIPCWGMEIQQDNSLDCFAHPWSATNGKFQFVVFGDQIAYAGAAAFPAVGDVDQGVTYGPTGSDYIGTLAQPAETDVLVGIQYGADGTEFTGSATSGGGGGGAVLIRRR